MRRHRRLLTLGLFAVCVGAVMAQGPPPDEEIARRQLESGRSFARQRNYAEALKDFRAVAETHANSSVADNALLEIARYYLDIVGDSKEAGVAVDAILKRYPTSDSAPDAYLMAGRLALARSRQGPDLDTALANFDRVLRLFPGSDAVPRSLHLAGETLWHAGRYEDALANLGRVEVEYPANPAAADAYLTAGRVLVSLGDPIAAMEELQQVRNRWPDSPEAATALAHITLIHRLYVKAKSGPAFALTAETPGPARLQNVVGLTFTGRQALYWATENSLAGMGPGGDERPQGTGRPRGIARDASGALVVIEGGTLRLMTGTPLSLAIPKSDGTPDFLSKIDGLVQLSNGDWLVMDGDQRGIQRFNRLGEYGATFAPARVTKLAVNAVDEVAGIDRDRKNFVFFDASGKPAAASVPFRGAGYDLQNPEDLTFDAFGHLYVLDRGAVAVFGPHPVAAAAGAAGASAAGNAPAAAARGRGAGAAPATPGRTYRLLTVFSEPAKAQTGLRRGTAFAVDQSGGVFVHDDRAQKILVYR